MHEQLTDTVEQLRKQGFAHLDKELVEGLLSIERDCLDVRDTVHSQLEQRIDSFLQGKDKA